MKKFALCLMVLALAVAIVPQSQAATRCIHFTNFCDSIQVQTASEPSYPGGKINWGGWDWLCTGNWTDANMIGNSAPKSLMATRPNSAVYSYLSPYTFGFGFVASGHLFNLLATDSVSVLTFQTSQPWTLTNGACRSDAINRSLPRLSSSRQ